MPRILICLSLLLMLSNCVPNGMALLGPSVTVATTGNVYQAGISYGSGQIVNKAKQSLKRIKETKKLVYKQVNKLNEKIINKSDKYVLKKQADLFFKAVKNNLKKNY